MARTNSGKNNPKFSHKYKNHAQACEFPGAPYSIDPIPPASLIHPKRIVRKLDPPIGSKINKYDINDPIIAPIPSVPNKYFIKVLSPIKIFQIKKPKTIIKTAMKLCICANGKNPINSPTKYKYFFSLFFNASLKMYKIIALAEA